MSGKRWFTAVSAAIAATALAAGPARADGITELDLTAPVYSSIAPLGASQDVPYYVANRSDVPVQLEGIDLHTGPAATGVFTLDGPSTCPEVGQELLPQRTRPAQRHAHGADHVGVLLRRAPQRVRRSARARPEGRQGRSRPAGHNRPRGTARPRRSPHLPQHRRRAPALRRAVRSRHLEAGGHGDHGALHAVARRPGVRARPRHREPPRPGEDAAAPPPQAAQGDVRAEGPGRARPPRAGPAPDHADPLSPAIGCSSTCGTAALPAGAAVHVQWTLAMYVQCGGASATRASRSARGS
jgi:hypothetical protein